MVHGFHPRSDFHFYSFIANSLRQGNLENWRLLPIAMFLLDRIMHPGSAGVPPACCKLSVETHSEPAGRRRSQEVKKNHFARSFLRQLRLMHMADRLPIYEIERDIVARLKTDRRLILSAPTGSGKSTQVPQMLLRHGLLGDGQVVILQPRRLATRLLASRVAQELGVQLGNEVGYQIRFENVTSPQTKIRFETEGVLLRQMIDDPKLRGVSVLIFDEFHERHLYGDITLARALDLQEQHRPDLNLIVMSATLDVELLEDYMNSRRGELHESQTLPSADRGVV